jgi:hypothetical protein
MSRNRQQVDPSQIPFDWSAKVEELIGVKQGLFRSIEAAPAPATAEANEMEDCIEIAAAVKHALRESGMSREQMVDAINAWYGRSDEGAEADPPTCRKPLTIHMLNNYLSKPCEYPIPAYYLFAIQAVTGIIEPAATIVKAAGGQVATAEEVKLLQLGKLEQTLDEVRRLKRSLKGGGR